MKRHKNMFTTLFSCKCGDFTYVHQNILIDKWTLSLKARSDQYQISPYSINTLSVRYLIRLKKNRQAMNVWVLRTDIWILNTLDRAWRIYTKFTWLTTSSYFNSSLKTHLFYIKANLDSNKKLNKCLWHWMIIQNQENNNFCVPD